MARIHAGPADALAPGERTFVKHRNFEIGVFNVNGEFRAYRNRCPHQLGPACEGAISGTLMGSADTDWQLEWVLDGRVLLCPGTRLNLTSTPASASAASASGSGHTPSKSTTGSFTSTFRRALPG